MADYMWLDLLYAIEEVVRCAVCLERIRSPVTLCINGHGMCSQCKGTFTVCSTCRQPFIPTTPRILHEILQVLPKPCKYSENGCQVPPFNDHELFCKFRPTTCMLREDKIHTWAGTVNDWIKHVYTDHAKLLTKYNTDEEQKLYYNEYKTVSGTRCFIHIIDNNNVFLLFSSKSGGKFSQAIRFIATEEPTYIFHFLISFKDIDGSVIYKYKMKAPEYNENESLENSVYCMSVPTEELDKLTDRRGNLEVTFEVIHEKIA